MATATFSIKTTIDNYDSFLPFTTATKKKEMVAYYLVDRMYQLMYEISQTGIFKTTKTKIFNDYRHYAPDKRFIIHEDAYKDALSHWKVSVKEKGKKRTWNYLEPEMPGAGNGIGDKYFTSTKRILVRRYHKNSKLNVRNVWAYKIQNVVNKNKRVDPNEYKEMTFLDIAQTIENSLRTSHAGELERFIDFVVRKLKSERNSAKEGDIKTYGFNRTEHSFSVFIYGDKIELQIKHPFFGKYHYGESTLKINPWINTRKEGEDKFFNTPKHDKWNSAVTSFGNSMVSHIKSKLF